MNKLVIASHNTGKLREFGELLAPLGFELVPQSELGVQEVEEPYDTFIENALTKARQAIRMTGLPALADDSGLCVFALDGAPGVRSARYAGEPKSDQRNNEKLVATLNGHLDRRAFYYCVLVLMRHVNDPHPLISEGCWQGEIAEKPRGSGGFGYDPYFFLPESDCTAAELSAEQKNRISHRGMALQTLVEKLKSQWL